MDNSWTRNVRIMTLAAAWISVGTVSAQAADTMPTGPVEQSAAPSAELTLGGTIVLRITGCAGGADPQERVDAITDRLTPVLAHPDIKPSDVVLYNPPGRSPAIYVLGRGLITVDKASAKQSGIGTQMQTAIVWAKRFQQILPLVDIRLPNEHEPHVPLNPPLVITTNLENVGGSVGDVFWDDRYVFSVLASPVPGITAAQYSDVISRRLAYALNPLRQSAVAITTQPGTLIPGSVDVTINGKRFISATTAEAKAAGVNSANVLAEIWAGNLQMALGAQ